MRRSGRNEAETNMMGRFKTPVNLRGSPRGEGRSPGERKKSEKECEGWDSNPRTPS